MARPLRYIPPDSVVEITCRTIQGRWLLKPSPALNDLVVGVLGRSMELHPSVQLHAFVFLSNHVHLLLSVPNGQVLASFMTHFNSNIAREAGRLYDWSDRLWGRRYRAIVVADEPAQVARLRYILSHGVKEGLVRRSQHWPGASSLRPLTHGDEVAGTWVDRTKAWGAGRRRGQNPPECCTRYVLVFTPLPCWQDLSRQETQRLCRELVDQNERDHESSRGGVLGAEAVLGQHPHFRPQGVKKLPAPFVHAVDGAVRVAFIGAYGAFADRCKIAAEQSRAGGLAAEFPALSFPPRPPWRPPPS